VTTCFSKPLANDNVLVQFGGSGYVWSNVTQRMSFDASGGIEYNVDFLLDGSTMYIYFRERSTTDTQFATKLVEQPVSAAGAGMQLGPNGQSLANAFGQQIMQNEIARGFTVIRDSDGSVLFGQGIVEKVQRPAATAPYEVKSGGVVLANERTEIHQN